MINGCDDCSNFWFAYFPFFFFKDDTELQYILIFDSLNIEVALKKDYPIVRQKSTLINTVKFSNLSV